jgi:hypothetical protein
MQGQKLIAMAESAGIAERTLRRASKRLNVVTKPDGFRGDWTWQLPDASTLGQPETVAESVADGQL